jgi:hypothetical protein
LRRLDVNRDVFRATFVAPAELVQLSVEIGDPGIRPCFIQLDGEVRTNELAKDLHSTHTWIVTSLIYPSKHDNGSPTRRTDALDLETQGQPRFLFV